ncbi:protein of unknown function [Acidithiobacillus ferrivorans]|uniref:Dihydroxy-acid/6-phosphogluconate dehydratase C-terminal domain-containing protein n=1 Tax=Acidithiobacillus ferrivorans TaxID=160808 RepID=A0A060ULQ8_9PROT|nr:dihydroxy-acid dehydratase [Acidithiobacillus ferrivorans]CDQ09405.1 hypothetical protein AFERRI_30051 [Acidithiobacillus ferrivorans]SMH66338.1 protein of unknown function [Acidithiobacillus ferrivorans]
MHEGDTITIDAPSLSRNLHVGNEELAKRRAAWTPPAKRYTRGVLAKFGALVGSSHWGAVLDADLA